jgi:hypothetical protein
LAFGGLIPLAFQAPHFLLALIETLRGWFPFASLTRGRSGWTAAAFERFLPARFAPLTTETAAVSAAATTLRLGTSFIDVQGAAFEIRTVQAGDGPVGFLGVAHFDKRKPAGAASITIRHQIDPINCSIPLKHGAHGRVGSGKIQIAYENILQFFTLSVFQLCGQNEAN